MDKQVNQAKLKLLIDAKQIEARIAELAQEIDNIYAGRDLVLVCVLRGGIFFFSDLARAITKAKISLEFVRLSSYGDATQTSHNLQLLLDTESDLTNKDILIIDDIIDSGLSMQFLHKHFLERGAKSVEIAILVDKKERRECEIEVKFTGFNVASGYLVGFGMDCAGTYRTLPGIYELII